MTSTSNFVSTPQARSMLQRISERGGSGVYATDAAASRRDADALEAMLHGLMSDNDRLTATLLLAQIHETEYQRGDVTSLERVVKLLGPLQDTFKPSDAKGRISMITLAIALLRDSERTGSTVSINRAVRIMKKLTRGGKGTADEYSLLVRQFDVVT